jgi:hypothetical protein
MTIMLHPGSDGEPLPSGTLIFRIGRDVHLNSALRERGNVSPGIFELTQEDKNSPGTRLSVWVEELTIADQAWCFMGSKPKNTLVACLHSDRIREITPPEGFARLDVEWERALNPDGTVNDSPGAQGHSGISNLHQGGEGKQDKARRMRLRLCLADIAMLSPVPVPHDIPDEYLRVAAYFVYQKNVERGASEVANWINAVRQLRRARVRDHGVPRQIVAGTGS